jgi:outer membrane protein
MKLLPLFTLGCLLSGSVLAYDSGDIIVRAGVATVDPAGDGALDGVLDVKSNSQLGLTLTYMLSEDWGVGVLAATPFKHDITVAGKTVGSTKHLPPTVTAQYHFSTGETVHPYVGLGVNYTEFFSEESVLGDLSLDSSFGLAAELGIDFSFNKNWGANLALWYIDIDTDASLDGAKLATVQIGPWVYNVGISYRF